MPTNQRKQQMYLPKISIYREQKPKINIIVDNII